ncbi:MAG: hypothetical protein PF549_01060 [Patescibacteria group bacterium]|nr:hypothetical protein [Patescibacteria group bacterium]
MNKSEIIVSEEERNRILQESSTRLVYIKSQDRVINVSSIVEIIRSDEMKNASNIGFLHDGLSVIRQFGRWYANDGNIDEQGRLQSAIDPLHYPEVASDRVMTEEQYEEVKHLPIHGIKKMIEVRKSNGFKGMKQLNKQKRSDYNYKYKNKSI